MHFLKWKEMNAGDIVKNLEVEHIRCAPLRVKNGEFTKDDKGFTYWEAMRKLEQNGEWQEYELDDERWDNYSQEAIIERIARKAQQGGLDETEHPWSELRKYVLKHIDTLEDTIQQGKEAEILRKQVLEGIPALNTMVKQEQKLEEATLNGKVK